MNDELTVERVRELFDYDPNAGVLTWRIRTSNRVGVGSEAGTSESNGYRRVEIAGRPYRVHRLVWLWVHGVWPANQIDHINGDCGDNRLANLREATCAENQQNKRRALRNSRSGVLGVSRASGDRGWMAYIGVDGRERYLGTFPTVAEASAAYVEAKRLMHPFGTL